MLGQEMLESLDVEKPSWLCAMQKPPLCTGLALWTLAAFVFSLELSS